MKPGLGQIDNNEECAINNLNIQAKMIHLKGRQKKNNISDNNTAKNGFYANSFPETVFSHW